MKKLIIKYKFQKNNIMKNTIKLLAIILVATLSIPFTACDDDILDVDFSTTISEKIDVNIIEGQTNVDESSTLSLDNKDTNKYLNKIKNVKITKLTYKITSFTGDPNGTINGSLYANTLKLDLNNFNVKEAYDNATIFEITDIDKLNEIATLLKNNKSVNIGIKGTINAANEAMNFEVEVTAKLDLTANPL